MKLANVVGCIRRSPRFSRSSDSSSSPSEGGDDQVGPRPFSPDKAPEAPVGGEAGSKHGELVEQIVNELVAAVSAKEGITFPEGTMARLAAYTDVVADFPCGVKEFEWRNKYFYDLGDEAVPIHNSLLKDCAERGLLSFELP